MIDFLTRLHSSTPIEKKNILNKIRYYSAVRFIVRSFASIAIPFYFNLNNALTKKNRLYNDSDLIVSFTSFPARIDKVWLVVESMLRQKYKPGRLILWLSKEQFPSLDVLPRELLKQQERGLEIKLVDGDLRSYKKYYYTLLNYPNSDFVIIDDDVFYPSDLISNLVNCSRSYPRSIIFNRGYRVSYNRDDVAPYEEWEALVHNEGPSKSIFATGVGGVYYPANSLHKEALNVSGFQEFCPLADDVWLYAAARLQGADLYKTDESKLFLPLLNKNSQTLTSENVAGGLNDKQIKQVRAYLADNYFDIFNIDSSHQL